MVARLRAIFFHERVWQTVEIALVGLFFWQGLRHFIGELYRQSASASLVAVYPVGSLDSAIAGYVEPSAFVARLMVLVVLLFLPIIAGIMGRWRWSLLIMALLMSVGRLNLNGNLFLDDLSASGLVVMAGLGYLVALAQIRGSRLPYLLIIGLGLEQLSRSFGDTLDPLLREGNLGLVAGLIGILLVSTFFTSWGTTPKDDERYRIPLWGGIGMGALLFLQLSLLGLPNAIAGRTDGSYSLLVPLVIGATLAPLIPFVRVQARQLVAPFDSMTRGWVWFLLLALLIVLGMRLPRIGIAGVGTFSLGAIVLVLAQLNASLLWWYLARPREAGDRNWSGVWVVVGVFTLGLMVLGDNFTYEYAFVRDFVAPLDSLNAIIPPLLRGFRGMGLGLLLIAGLLAVMPMVLGTKRIPWERGQGRSFLMVMIVSGVAGLGGLWAQPPLVTPLVGVNEMRIGTYNIHGGYSEFFDYDIPSVSRAISQSGADVVLLQEVDAGRLASYGVDQSLWLARRLGMDRRFYGTVEGLRGLAVLSRAPIVFDDGVPLQSIDLQTGLQRVQVLPGEVPITFYNTALGLLLEGDSLEEQERNQRQQLNQILVTIDEHIERDYGGRVENVLMVLGGTFHNVPDSPLLEVLERTGFSDPFAGSNPELSATLVRADRRGRIDYLWIWRQGLLWTGNGVIDSAASDHRLAFVNLLFGR